MPGSLRSSFLSCTIAVFAIAGVAKAQSQVVAWGHNTYGQCNVPALPSGLSYVEIAAGQAFTVARRSNGSVVAWGQNMLGQCNVPALPSGLVYIDVAAGSYYAVARRSNGSVVAWGDNRYGQCNVPALPSGLTYVEVAAGGFHTVARRSDGSVVAWGANGFGQCNVPALPSGLAYVEVAAGDAHTVARLSDGSVVACGDNGYGQCNVPAPPSGLTYVEVAAGIYFSVARCSDDSVVAWGDSSNGKCNVPAGLTCVDVSARGEFTAARSSNGYVIAWGDNWAGQCNVPGFPTGFTYVEVAAGGFHAVARTAPAPPSTYCTAKVNSIGCTPSIDYTGMPKLSGPDDFCVTASNVLNRKVGMLLWSPARTSIPWRGGLRCFASPFTRTPFQSSGGTPAALGNDCTGMYSYNFRQAYMTAHHLAPGSSVYCQYWSNDPFFSQPNNIGLTDGLRFSIEP